MTRMDSPNNSLHQENRLDTQGPELARFHDMCRETQRGFTILEILAAFAVGAMMMAGLVTWIEESLEDTKGQQASLYQLQIAAAATKYISANYATLQTTATATAPAKIDVAGLKSGGFLSSNFNAKNAYGQTPCVLVLKPTADRLEALVVTEGGQDIPSKNLGVIAANSGQGGGSIAAANPTVAQGSFNSWQLTLASYVSAANNCSGTPAAKNHLVTAIFFDGPGNLSTDYLYRNVVPGHPELNQMSTPLNMRAQAVEDGSDALCIVGDASTYGRISVDSIGAVLSCQAGVWRRQGSRFWRDPVDTFALLPTTGNNVGDVRMVTALARGFTWNGTSWVALAVDQNGDMTVPGKTATSTLQLNQIVAEKTACSPDGLVARDVNGLVLSCQLGLWQAQSSTELAYTETDYTVILPSTKLSYPAGKTYTGAFTYDAGDDFNFAPITRKVTPAKNGLLIVNAWSMMDRENYPDSSVVGQFVINLSIRNDDNGAIIGSTRAMSTLIQNDTAAISTSLSKAVPKNINGYTAIIETAWSTYLGNNNFYYRSYYRNAFNQIVEATPLQTGWTLDLFY